MSRKVNTSISLGAISLTKPSNWSLGIHENILAKLKLNKYLFAKYILYYAQGYPDSEKKVSFNEINRLAYSEVLSVLLLLLNADEKILNEINEGRKFEESERAYDRFKIYLENDAKQLVSLLMGVFMVVSIQDNWINALRGKVEMDHNNRLRKMASVFKMVYDESIEMLDEKIKPYFHKLREFDKTKEDYILMCKTFSDNIKKIHSAEMWIPSRYSKEITNGLRKSSIKNLSKNEIEQLIFKHFKKDDEKRILSELIQSPVFDGRGNILEQAFKAHSLGLFAPAITCFLTQLDYILVEIAILMNRDNGSRITNHKILENIADYIEDVIIGKQPLSEFFPQDGDISKPIYLFQIKSLGSYLRNIVFEDTARLKDQWSEFNRHGILHGKFMDYPTCENSRKIILLIDDLNTFYKKISVNLR